MKNSKREELISHSAVKLFNIVLDIESYPEYIPWCTKMVINERKKNETVFASVKFYWLGYFICLHFFYRITFSLPIYVNYICKILSKLI